MEGEGRRSKEAVRNSIRTYGVKVLDPAALPLKKNKVIESQESVNRFSEQSLHEPLKIKRGIAGKIRNVITSMPYASILAFIILILGVLISGVAALKAVKITHTMVREVMKKDTDVVSKSNAALITFEVICALVGILALIFAFLTTGKTRSVIYKDMSSRFGGRIACVMLIALCFLQLIIWLLIFYVLSAAIMSMNVGHLFCDEFGGKDQICRTLTMLQMFHSDESKPIPICSAADKKKFCKDFLEKCSPLFVLCEIGAFMVLIGLVLYLICLSANYVRIQCESKFRELEELKRVNGQ